MSIPKDNVKIHTEPRLIKNPFICDTATGVRLSLDKDPRKNKDNGTQYVEEYISENGNHHLVSQTNPLISYCFGTAEEKEDERTSSKYVDYSIPAEILNQDRKDKIHKDPLPLSFIQIKTEEEGIEWYSINYPKIPTDLLPIIARYHWGKPITKKGLKKEKKKIQQKLQHKGLHVEQRKVIVKFD